MQWEEYLAKDIAYWHAEGVRLHNKLNTPPDNG